MKKFSLQSIVMNKEAPKLSKDTIKRMKSTGLDPDEISEEQLGALESLEKPEKSHWLAKLLAYIGGFLELMALFSLLSADWGAVFGYGIIGLILIYSGYRIQSRVSCKKFIQTSIKKHMEHEQKKGVTKSGRENGLPIFSIEDPEKLVSLLGLEENFPAKELVFRSALAYKLTKENIEAIQYGLELETCVTLDEEGTKRFLRCGLYGSLSTFGSLLEAGLKDQEKLRKILGVLFELYTSDADLKITGESVESFMEEYDKKREGLDLQDLKDMYKGLKVTAGLLSEPFGEVRDTVEGILFSNDEILNLNAISSSTLLAFQQAFSDR